MTIEEIKALLISAQADFQLIEQDAPILSTADAEKYYDIGKAAPTFILQNEDGLLACIVSSGHGRLDLENMKKQFGYSKLKIADRKKVEEQTGYKVGTIPLIGHGLPCIFDDKLLRFDTIFGGTGNEFVTLKISPKDVKRLNRVIAILV